MTKGKNKIIEFIVKHGKRMLKIETVKPSKVQIIKTYLTYAISVCKGSIKLITGKPECKKVVSKNSLQLMADGALKCLSRFRKFISSYFHRTLKFLKFIIAGWVTIPKEDDKYQYTITFR
jgi:hypothetical protein